MADDPSHAAPDGASGARLRALTDELCKASPDDPRAIGAAIRAAEAPFDLLLNPNCLSAVEWGSEEAQQLTITVEATCSRLVDAVATSTDITWLVELRAGIGRAFGHPCVIDLWNATGERVKALKGIDIDAAFQAKCMRRAAEDFERRGAHPAQAAGLRREAAEREHEAQRVRAVLARTWAAPNPGRTGAPRDRAAHTGHSTRAARRASQSRSGRGSPPGESGEDDPPGDHAPPAGRDEQGRRNDLAVAAQAAGFVHAAELVDAFIAVVAS